MEPVTSILATTLVDSAFDIFKYVVEKYGAVSDEIDLLTDVYDTIFSEELASELQRQIELYKVQQLANTIIVDGSVVK